MVMVTGGAYEGKQGYAEKLYGPVSWIDGDNCDKEDIFHCQGILHFQDYVRRFVGEEAEAVSLAEAMIQQNPNLVIVVSEVGSGVVPMDRDERQYRELVGRTCTRLAKDCSQVNRVVCGIGQRIK